MRNLLYFKIEFTEHGHYDDDIYSNRWLIVFVVEFNVWDFLNHPPSPPRKPGRVDVERGDGENLEDLTKFIKYFLNVLESPDLVGDYMVTPIKSLRIYTYLYKNKTRPIVVISETVQTFDFS